VKSIIVPPPRAVEYESQSVEGFYVGIVARYGMSSICVEFLTDILVVFRSVEMKRVGHNQMFISRYLCESCSVTLRDENGLKLFENGDILRGGQQHVVG
jgi:hypothetical protein